MTFWPLAHSTWGQEEINAAMRVLKSGHTTMSVCVEKFEQEFARFHNMPHAIMVNSGSSANLIAIAALSNIPPALTDTRPLRNWDTVLVPAISWATTYYPFLQYGMKLRILDVDINTLNMDLDLLRDAMSEAGGRAYDAIVGVSILGNPAPLAAMSGLAKTHNALFIEDNCESLGAIEPITKRLTGTFGVVNTFSFFYSHHINTMEGGMILTSDEIVAELCRSLRNHGWTRGLKRIWHSNNETFEEAYKFILPGYNVRPLEICGAIGLEQLKKLPSMNQIRRKNWALFERLFKDDDRFILQKQNGESQPFGFTMICKDKKFRPSVFEKLRQADIEFRMITGGNFLRHPVAVKFSDRISGHCPNANIVHEQGFFVGNHPYDLSKQIYRLKEILK